MRKGEIYLVEIPSNSGHEQSGLRPVIVMSEVNARVISVIPFTSNFSALKYSYTIEVRSSSLNKLRKDSVALVFQLRAIDIRKLKSKLGDLEEDTMREINDLIKKLFGINK